jgi:Site-specific recombinases, DNA invertase Pin homologs
MLDYLRDDDEVIVLSLDRLGRNSADLTEIMEAIRHKGATLNILNLPSFNSIEDPNLRNLITNIIIELYKYMAQEERETIKVRQRQGIEIAKRQGKYHGKVREYGPHSPNRQKRYIYKEACRLLTRPGTGRRINQTADRADVGDCPSYPLSDRKVSSGRPN